MKTLILLILSAVTSAATTLSWNAVPDPSVTGYRLNYGTAAAGFTQSVDVPSTSATIQLSPGTTYKFRVYSIGAQYCWPAIPNVQTAGCDRVISAPSSEVVYTTEITLPSPTLVPLQTPTPGIGPTFPPSLFSMTVTTPPAIAPRGWTTICNVTLTRATGFTAPVSFTWSGIAGVTGSFSPPSATGTTKKVVMTLTIDDCLPGGSYPFAVIATGETTSFPTATKNATLVKQKP